MNAEEIRTDVDFRCEACGSPMGAVHRVRNYHHTEIVFGPSGPGDPPDRKTRTTDLADGLVVTSKWWQSEEPRKNRRLAGPEEEWPVPGVAAPLVWCTKHGMHESSPADVVSWAEEAAAAPQRRITVRLPVQQHF